MKAILPYGIAIYLEQRPTKSDNGSHFCWYSSDSSLVCVPNFMKPLLFSQQWLSPADHVWQWNLHCCDRGLLFGDFPWFQAWHASDGCLRQPSEVEYGDRGLQIGTVWPGLYSTFTEISAVTVVLMQTCYSHAHTHTHPQTHTHTHTPTPTPIPPRCTSSIYALHWTVLNSLLKKYRVPASVRHRYCKLLQ